MKRRTKQREQLARVARERMAEAERLAHHPLNPLPTVKIRIAVVIFVAVSVTVFVFWCGTKIGIWPSVSGVLAMLAAFVMVRYLARGLTTPLRDIARAADAMAAGDYSQRVAITSRDEISALAVAFNRMADQLAETDRLRRDLVANVSHELRTPITALQAKLENLVDGIEPPDVDTFRVMHSQVERLGRLVHQLLDLSRLESGAVPLDRQPIRAETLLARSVREAGLQGAPVVLTYAATPSDLELIVDPERVAQVLANLLANAITASPINGTVHTEAHAAGNTVVITVEDDGPGIPADEVDRIFERFYRADVARSRQHGGAGLGLAISRWIVDLHGGNIHPELRQPHGCRMVVTLPEARLVQPTTATPDTEPVAAPTLEA